MHAVVSTFEGTVYKVSDGDTLQVETKSGKNLKIKLYGCDAPEIEKRHKKSGKIIKPGQPYGEQAKQALQTRVYKKKVRVDVINIDRDRRLESIIWRKDRNINLEMVREGYAEAYWEYLKQPYYAKFLDAEQNAKYRRKGIWGLKNYERPSTFRKRMMWGERPAEEFTKKAESVFKLTGSALTVKPLLPVRKREYQFQPFFYLSFNAKNKLSLSGSLFLEGLFDKTGA